MDQIAQEERAYRKWATKCTEAEERNTMLAELVKSEVGLAEVENFVRSEESKLRGGGKKNKLKLRRMVVSMMKDKLRDNINFALKARKMRDKKRWILESTLGKNSKQYREMVKNVKKHGDRLRRKTKKRYKKKVKFLVGKYGMKTSMRDAGMTGEEYQKYGGAKIFSEKCELVAEDVKGPVLVCQEGEEILLSEDEVKFLSLGPKFNILKKLRMDDFEPAIEEAIMKFKWDSMGDESSKELSDIAMDVLLKNICTEDEYDDMINEIEEIKMRGRMVYDRGVNRFSYAKKKVTDFKGNSRVTFPREVGKYEDEAALEMLRMELTEVFKKYCGEKCMKGGVQTSNLSKSEMNGMKSLQKRVSKGEILVVPTDKSGRFAVMSVPTYELAGSAHTKKDEEVSPSVVRSTQTELNGNVSMLIKVFKIGAEWGHSDRMRETMLNNSLSLCPLYLLYKDHKGWTWEKGPVPPTRPVASGNRGMNMHLSEILSDILEPVADGVADTCEVISTEDMVARLLRVDKSLENWTEVEWLRGVVYDGFEACLVCKGEEEYILDVNNPEVCKCMKDGVMKDMFQCNTDNEEEELQIKDLVKDIDEPRNLCPEGGNGVEITKVTVGFMEKLRKRRWSDILEEVPEGGWVNSNDVSQEMIQDFSKPLEIIGWDVNALYPSLDWETTEGVIREAVMESNIKWEDIDIMEGCRYIALNLSAEDCRKSNLARILPVRRSKNGVRPGVKGAGPMGSEPHDQEQWRFPEVTIKEEEKREVIATVVAIATKVLFSNHLYTFSNKVYRQKSGGAIGLRATCAIARVTMNTWDQLWTRRMKDLNLRKEVYTRYMDDGRAMMYPIRAGWRFKDGQVRFCKQWETEDQNLTPTFRTMKVVEGTMKGLIQGLEMTMETKEDFDGKWLPTLDVSLAMSDRNRLMFKHYEKPTCSNLTMQNRSAMEHNIKMGIMANEVIRRLLNMGGDIGTEERWEILDGYAVKLLNSGYTLETARRIILSGIRGYDAKVTRREQNGIPLYRTALESGKSRNRKKLMGKSTWFKKGGGEGTKTINDGKVGGNSRRRKGNINSEGEIKTRTVIFVEHTPGGELSKRIREQLSRIEGMMGFKMKVVERSGTQIKDLFSLTNVWGGIPCDRKECTTCQQGIEEIPDCTRRSVVYESICKKCVPKATRPGPVDHPEVDTPCIYVGESSRSIFERAGEHWDSYKARKPDSHIWKHHLVHHDGQGEPEMIFKVVGSFRSALSRQIYEAVRMKNRGILALNSKGEYDRCRIHRLTVEEHQKSNWQEQVPKNSTDGTKGEQYLMNKRIEADRNNRRDAQGNVSVTKPKKRNNMGEEVTRPSKKRKYVLVGPNWGESTDKGNQGLNCLVSSSGGTTVEAKGNNAPVPGSMNTLEPTVGGQGNNNEVVSNKETTVELNIQDKVPTVWAQGNNASGNMNNVEPAVGSQGNKDHSTLNNGGPTVGCNDIQLSMVTEDERGNSGTCPLSTVDRGNTGLYEASNIDNDDVCNTGLYEAASNVRILREARQDCIVKKMWCTVHNQEARRYTSTKQVWTKIKKTGLYAYRARKVSVLRCDGHMGTYLGTMERLDGAGADRESNYCGGTE